MKSNHCLKFLILITPLNAMAHPGHEGFIDRAGLSGLTSYILVSALACTALAGLIVFLNYSRRRKD